MTVPEFQRTWRGHPLNERQAYQTHFNDLCELVGHAKPGPDTWPAFTFEKAVSKFGGGKGFADVWKRDYFGVEYKGPHANLQAAARQLLLYRKDLENPPLLVVCDTDLIRIQTDFSRTENVDYEITLGDLSDADSLRFIEWMFWEPDKLRPTRSPDEVTQAVAARIGDLAGSMRDRGIPAPQAAHFLMKVIFSLFAEDVGLLPRKLFTDLLAETRDDPPAFADSVRQLFAAMATGGRFFFKAIEHFNGGLFDDPSTCSGQVPVLALTRPELRILSEVAQDDWANIEPAVFGTLFERCLDPAKRGQLGAHFTSKADIERIIEPVLMAPLRREWAAIKAECDAEAEQAAALSGQKKTNRLRRIEQLVAGFMDRLAAVQVLDPACGSGNFLYVALNALKDLELEVVEATAHWGCQAPFPAVEPSQLHGLEIDPYAAELAQVTCWIGYLQWNHKRKFQGSDRPLLRKLDTIRQMDAIVGYDEHGRPEAPEWPRADVIVGNPPFLGDKKLRSELGDDYVQLMTSIYDGKVPGGADLCCYWFDRASEQIATGRVKRAGLLATNSIRYGRNRVVLDRIADRGGIFMAWSDEPWILNGAAVRISLVGFDGGETVERELDGQRVALVLPDLTSAVDLRQASSLKDNRGLASFGLNQAGPFDLDEDRAADFRSKPVNPNGRPNSDVVRPYVNGRTLMQRRPLRYVVDFFGMSEREAALYEAPYEYLREHVKPIRAQNRDKKLREQWWLHQRPRPALHDALVRLDRYLVTPEVTRHRVFVWVPATILPDHQLLAVMRDDDFTFGVLQSRAHEVWTVGRCSWLGKGNDVRYTPTTCLDSFAFPRPDADLRSHVEIAAAHLDRQRSAALDNDRKLNLTDLYGRCPTWLANLHHDLDAAVLRAYGWDDLLEGLPRYGQVAPEWTNELLGRLLELNLARAAEESG